MRHNCRMPTPASSRASEAHDARDARRWPDRVRHVSRTLSTCAARGASAVRVARSRVAPAHQLRQVACTSSRARTPFERGARTPSERLVGVGGRGAPPGRNDKDSMRGDRRLDPPPAPRTPPRAAPSGDTGGVCTESSVILATASHAIAIFSAPVAVARPDIGSGSGYRPTTGHSQRLGDDRQLRLSREPTLRSR